MRPQDQAEQETAKKRINCCKSKRRSRRAEDRDKRKRQGEENKDTAAKTSQKLDETSRKLQIEIGFVFQNTRGTIASTINTPISN